MDSVYWSRDEVRDLRDRVGYKNGHWNDVGDESSRSLTLLEAVDD
jgi:hypothetical protein